MAFFYIFASLDFTSMARQHQVGQAEDTVVEKAGTHTEFLKGNKKIKQMDEIPKAKGLDSAYQN